MRTLVSGSSSVICRQASMPSISGIITSMTDDVRGGFRSSFLHQIPQRLLSVGRLGHHPELPVFSRASFSRSRMMEWSSTSITLCTGFQQSFTPLL